MTQNDKYIEIIRNKLTPFRFEHSLNVAMAAVELAQRYGANVQKAYLAGLLHDIMKDTQGTEQLQIMENSGIVLTNVERGNHKLWHAISGAAFLKNELEIEDDEILLAVRYHTTARAGMSLLEKVIYVADFVSQDRHYSGVDRMVEKSKISLELAMLEALQFCIIKLLEKEHTVHNDSINAYNEILTQKGE